MQRLQLARTAGILAMLAAGTLAVAGQDRFSVTSPNGIGFAEIKGYDTWEVIAPSGTADGIKVILGNPLMMRTYAAGFPASGGTVPDGAMMAKVIWNAKASPFPPGAMVPDTLRKVQVMIKDARRFPDTDGCGCADFMFDATSGAFTAAGSGPGSPGPPVISVTRS
jgi:hypothetical protein